MREREREREGWGGGVKSQKSSPRHWQGLANVARRTMQVQLPTHLAISNHLLLDGETWVVHVNR